jgi:hypothetical protein
MAIAGKTDSHENSLMLLLFNNTSYANIGNAGGILQSTVAGSFYISLHTADPDESGSQTTNEVAYTNYARVAVARSSGGFTVTGGSVALVADVTFPASASAGGTATFWGLGVTSGTGAGVLLYASAISPSIACTSGVTPKLTAGTIVTEA